MRVSITQKIAGDILVGLNSLGPPQIYIYLRKSQMTFLHVCYRLSYELISATTLLRLVSHVPYLLTIRLCCAKVCQLYTPIFKGTKSAPKDPKQDPLHNPSFNFKAGISCSMALPSTAPQIFILAFIFFHQTSLYPPFGIYMYIAILFKQHYSSLNSPKAPISPSFNFRPNTSQLSRHF
jgi:hypothetical protein